MSKKENGDQAGQIMRGRPFAKGNPGRPRGARNTTTLALEFLLDGQAEAIVSRAIKMALGGDRAALRLCFDRILGARRDRPVSLDLPPIKNAGDGVAALAAVIAAVAEGRVTPSEAAQISQLIAATISVIEVSDFETRLEALERGRADAAGGQ